MLDAWAELGLGVGLALVMIVGARLVGFERDRSFYPTVLIVIALLYMLFAAMASQASFVVEAAVAAGFVAMAILGYRRSAWWLVAGYLLHAGWDAAHDLVVINDGIPPQWPGFCFGFDAVVAVYLARHARRNGVGQGTIYEGDM